MKDKLKTLFDYQRFENDEKLARLIKDSESRLSGSGLQPLDDSDLSQVNAAGDSGSLLERINNNKTDINPTY